MKGIIIYKSKYGATKKYAEWIADATGYDITELSKAKTKDIILYQNLILCGAIYASGISGIPFLRKNIDKLTKNIAVFCVGASPYDKSSFNEIKDRNLKNLPENLPIFYGRGAWDESKMKLADRMLCKMLQKVVAKKDPATYQPWETALVNAFGKTCDWTDKKYILPLLDCIRQW